MGITVIQGTDTVSSSRAVINDNFAYLAGILVIAYGSATLTFPSMADGETQELTFAVAGAVAGRPVAPGWPAAFPAKWEAMMFVSAGGNTITVRITNGTGVTATVPPLPFSASVL
jgi:hypothetical protein